ncbi:hypothetical protein SUGI_0761300 [Cryptomeria japonica]|nr:hypothetical protein SUGI_0761300 [Cryptomeria japonica]
MALDFAAWELALAMKRPLKTELYELHTIYEEEEEEQIEDTPFLSRDSQVSRHKSQLEMFSFIVILVGILISLLALLDRPLPKGIGFI